MKEPILVTYKADWGRVFQLSDFDELLDELPEKAEAKKGGSTAHLAGSQFNDVIDCNQIALNEGLTLVRTDPNGDEHYHYPARPTRRQ